MINFHCTTSLALPVALSRKGFLIWLISWRIQLFCKTFQTFCWKTARLQCLKFYSTVSKLDPLNCFLRRSFPFTELVCNFWFSLKIMEKLSEKISLTSQTFSDSSEARTILSFRIAKGDEHEDERILHCWRKHTTWLWNDVDNYKLTGLRSIPPARAHLTNAVLGSGTNWTLI